MFSQYGIKFYLGGRKIQWISPINIIYGFVFILIIQECLFDFSNVFGTLKQPSNTLWISLSMHIKKEKKKKIFINGSNDMELWLEEKKKIY